MNYTDTLVNAYDTKFNDALIELKKVYPDMSDDLLAQKLSAIFSKYPNARMLKVDAMTKKQTMPAKELLAWEY